MEVYGVLNLGCINDNFLTGITLSLAKANNILGLFKISPVKLPNMDTEAPINRMVKPMGPKMILAVSAKGASLKFARFSPRIPWVTVCIKI